VEAAGQITKGVDRDPYAVGLTRQERMVVLACLELAQAAASRFGIR